MERVNVQEAKTHLSKYIERVKKGETIVLCQRNVPVAEIRALPQVRTEPRPLGMFAGEIQETDDCWAPMTEEEQALWDGSESNW